MVFVRYKTVKGHRYYQLVRNYREDGNHRQEVLCHLGPHDSIDAAIEAERRRIAPELEPYEWAASYARERLATAEEGLAELSPLYGPVLDEAEARQIEAELSPDRYDGESYDRWLHANYSHGYHEAKRDLASYEAFIAARRARLDKLLDAQEKYF